MLIEPLAHDDVPESLRRYGSIATSTNMVIHGLGRCPEILADWLELYDRLIRRDGALRAEDKELIRRQIASLYECGLCQSFVNTTAADQGFDDDKAACVLEPDERYSERERAMLAFTRKVFTGPDSVDATAFADVRRHFGEAEITEMGFVAAMLTGWGRLTFGFDVVNDAESHLYEIA